MTKATINFHYEEFDSPDSPGSGKKYMKQRFLNRLQAARSIARIPFKINSGFRTKTYHEQLGARGYQTASNSPHLRGWAADIAARTSREKFIILSALLQAGFNRIGIASNYIHVDSDPNKYSNLIWTYNK